MPRARKPVAKPAPIPLDKDDFAKPVAIYYRQSSGEQVGNISTAIQQIDLVAEMKRRGWTDDQIILIDADAGVSGRLAIDEREGMSKLFEFITEEKIGTVAAQSEDRLFRDDDQIQPNVFIAACRQHRVQVLVGNMRYVFHDPVYGSYHREMFRQKSKAAADYIYDVVIGKLGAARARLEAEGKWNGRRLPRGYMVDMRDARNSTYRTFVPFEPFAAVVLELFQTFVEANGNAADTARRLKLRNVVFPTLEECPPPLGYRVNYDRRRLGRIPIIETIIEICANPFYAGHFTSGQNGAITRYNNHPAIVPTDLFTRAFNLASPYSLDGSANPHYKGTRLKSVRPNKRAERTAERPLLEGLIWLWIEGKWEHARTHYRVPTGAYHYVYDFNNRIPDGTIFNRQSGYIDAAVTFYLRQRLQATAVRENLDSDLKEQEHGLDAKLKRLDSQIVAIERATEDVVQKLMLLTDLTLVKAIEAQYAGLKLEHERLLAQREELKSRGAVFNRQREITSLILEWAQEDELPSEAKRLLVSALIARIEIPSFDAHQKAEVVIKWRDEQEDTVFTLDQRKRAGWSFEETQVLKHYVERHASQVILSAALPSRTFMIIRQAITNRWGRVNIPYTRTVYKRETFSQYLYRVHGITLSGKPMIIDLSPDELGVLIHDFEDRAYVVSEKGECARVLENVISQDNTCTRLSGCRGHA